MILTTVINKRSTNKNSKLKFKPKVINDKIMMKQNSTS